jgi:putative PIN family toxin of toxin-antitoxin system
LRIFLDTNVLVSAFATRGLCADVLRLTLAEHELVLGQPVLAELRRVLRVKLRLPKAVQDAIEQFLREHEVVPKPREAAIRVRDPADRWILATAIAARADVLLTGDRDLLEVAGVSPVRILTPRELWRMLQNRTRGD